MRAALLKGALKESALTPILAAWFVDALTHLADVEPAKYFVLVSKREKRAGDFCKEGAVVAAALSARVIEKSLASDQVVIDTVVAEYSDHLPPERGGGGGDRC